MHLNLLFFFILSLFTFVTNAFVISTLDTAIIVFAFSATTIGPFLVMVYGLSLFAWIKTTQTTDLMVRPTTDLTTLPCTDLIVRPPTDIAVWVAPEDILARPLLNYCPPTTDLVVWMSPDEILTKFLSNHPPTTTNDLIISPPVTKPGSPHNSYWNAGSWLVIAKAAICGAAVILGTYRINNIQLEPDNETDQAAPGVAADATDGTRHKRKKNKQMTKNQIRRSARRRERKENKRIANEELLRLNQIDL